MLYHIEVTDTFAGEANYAWKRDYLVEAVSNRGAILAFARSEGGGWRKDFDIGGVARYNMKGACICAFVMEADENTPPNARKIGPKKYSNNN
jgi:hypothetical protein